MEFFGKKVNNNNNAKPILVIVFMQFLYAWMSIVAKLAMNRGMSPHILVAYRMVVATTILAPIAFFLERKKRPMMTFGIFAKISLLSLFEPVLDQNLYYMGMKHTTATFTAATTNILPALTFIMACLFRMERVDIRRRHSQAKIMGTLVAVGGAMLMTLVKGPDIYFSSLPNANINPQSSTSVDDKADLIKGVLMITAGCFSWSSFIILQAFILKSYPAALSLTGLMCMMGMVQSTILALIVERGNPSAWSIHFDINLLASVYGGVVSGAAFYIMGWAAKQKGPVFVSSFNPLNMVIVAIASFFILSEQMYTGRIIGAGVIVLGIYIVLWGKSNDQPLSNPQTSSSNGMLPTSEEMATTPSHDVEALVPPTLNLLN